MNIEVRWDVWHRPYIARALKLYLTGKCSRVLSSKIWQKTARSGSVSYIYSYIYDFVWQRNLHTRPRIPQFLDNPYLGDITSRHEDSWQSIFCTRFLHYPLVHKCAGIYANSAEKEESSTDIQDRSQSQWTRLKKYDRSHSLWFLKREFKKKEQWQLWVTAGRCHASWKLWPLGDEAAA